MRVHPSIANAYWSQIHGSRRSKSRQRLWGFPCGASLPDFIVKFGSGEGGEVVIPGRLMNAGLLGDGAPEPREFLLSSNSSRCGSVVSGDPEIRANQEPLVCTGALQGRQGRGSFGAIFFEAFFVVFNQAEPSISVAPHAHISRMEGGKGREERVGEDLWE